MRTGRNGRRVRRMAGVGAVTVAGVCLAAADAAAQTKPVEFGVDGGILHVRFDAVDTPAGRIEGRRITGLVFPVGGVRMGFWLGDRVALDLAGAVSLQRHENGTGDGEDVTSTSLRLIPGLVWHFSEAGRHAQPYVRADGGVQYLRVSRSGSADQWHAGGAVGVKVPFASTAFLRLEAGYTRVFEGGGLRGLHEFRLGTGIGAVIN